MTKNTTKSTQKTKAPAKGAKLGNQSDLAGLLDISRQAVSAGIKKGWVTVRPDGQIDLKEAVKSWYSHCDMSQKRPFNAQSGGEGKGNELDRYLVARANHEEEKAALAKIERLEKERSLVSVEEAKKEFFECSRTIRDRVLQLPKRLAPMLVGLEQRQITIKLQDELTAALFGLEKEILQGGETHGQK